LSLIRDIPGIHIQWPWSRLLISGKKVIETRGYPLPERYRNVPLAIIETPGRPRSKSKIESSSVIGTIIFSESKLYRTQEEWAADSGLHMVSLDDLHFAFKNGKEKWGWIVRNVQVAKKPTLPPKVRGIIYAKNCCVEL
jgi:hypothetical protein